MKTNPLHEWKVPFAIGVMAVSLFLEPASAEKTVKLKAKSDSKPTASSKKVAVGSLTQIAHGKKLFERLTCAGCHPSGGNTLHPYRPLKGPEFLSRYKEDGQIEKLIRAGVARAGMPAFSKTQVNDKDMKDLIAFIRSMTPSTNK